MLVLCLNQRQRSKKIDLASSEVLVNDVRQVKAAVNHLSSSCTDRLAKWQNDLDWMFETDATLRRWNFCLCLD